MKDANSSGTRRLVIRLLLEGEIRCLGSPLEGEVEGEPRDAGLVDLAGEIVEAPSLRCGVALLVRCFFEGVHDSKAEGARSTLS